MEHKLDYLPPEDLYGSEKDKCEFGISETKCYFCQQPRVILTNEHYLFCPNCMALYTFMILQESGCDHIEDGVPYVEQAPRYIKDIACGGPDWNKPYIYWDCDDRGDGVFQRCSKCHEECVADGW